MPSMGAEGQTSEDFSGDQLSRGVTVCSTYPLRGDSVLVVSSGSVINFEGDAIVNAANEGCLTGGGVDGAITEAGGPELAKARKALPIVGGSKKMVRCPTGEARLTIGGDLKVPFCIHAVGPNYRTEMMCHQKTQEDCDALVTSAYSSAMRCAAEKQLQTVGFSLISAGIFRGEQSLENVLAAGVSGIAQSVYPELREVHLIAFTGEECDALEAVCSNLLSDKVNGKDATVEVPNSEEGTKEAPTEEHPIEAAMT